MDVHLNTKECNQLIADFMKLKKSDNNGVITYKRRSSLVTLDNLKYHKSWNWLMEVVMKIENPLFATRNRNNMNFTVNILTDECEIYVYEFLDEVFYKKCISVNKYEAVYLDGKIISHRNGGRKIGKTYEAVIKFIKWYNKNY